MKVKQSISFDKQLLEKAKETAKNQRRSLSSIVDQALFNELYPPTLVRALNPKATKQNES